MKFTVIRDTSRTIVFYEAGFVWGYDIHYARKGDVGFADSHVEFLPFPDQNGECIWDAPGTAGL